MDSAASQAARTKEKLSNKAQQSGNIFTHYANKSTKTKEIVEGTNPGESVVRIFGLRPNGNFLEPR